MRNVSDKDIESLSDKKNWGPGPWQDEPDHVEFEHAGLPCILHRNKHVTGAWCGYAVVTPGHPLYKRAIPTATTVSRFMAVSPTQGNAKATSATNRNRENRITFGGLVLTVPMRSICRPE